MDLVIIRLRKTHRYVDEYRHMDRHEFIGRVKLTPARMVRAPEGFDDGGTYVRYCRLPRDMDKAQVKQALTDTFSHWGCSHEHDCCGCSLTRASVKPINGRTLKLTIDVSYNY